MMNKLLLTAIITAFGICTAQAATDVRNLANSCAICHGTDGKPPRGGIERLAGMKPKEFIDAMHQMQKGGTEGHLMTYVARGFSDAEIKQMADYFSKLH
jgi:sulfide dehydrogenase cytochrome subunit